MLAIVNASISLAAIVRSSSGRPPSSSARRPFDGFTVSTPRPRPRSTRSSVRSVVRPRRRSIERNERTKERARESSVDRDARSIDGRGVRDVDARGDE